jgi:hypothetical protein
MSGEIVRYVMRQIDGSGVGSDARNDRALDQSGVVR